ncbi:hypothetical protein DY000_02024007 [Brassica cretica]|uniref:Uncharacterized protein n=1 Tax=Brassica cretica TaxID=69181 RepID=A0ABQ7EDP6_BRACR|nr:hypothetical protein DY000_02024007 [Brassica cretica]
MISVSWLPMNPSNKPIKIYLSSGAVSFNIRVRLFLEKRDGEGKTFLNTLGEARLWMERYSGMTNPALSSLFQVFDLPLNVPYFTNLPNPHDFFLLGLLGE